MSTPWLDKVDPAASIMFALWIAVGLVLVFLWLLAGRARR